MWMATVKKSVKLVINVRKVVDGVAILQSYRSVVCHYFKMIRVLVVFFMLSF